MKRGQLKDVTAWKVKRSPADFGHVESTLDRFRETRLIGRDRLDEAEYNLWQQHGIKAAVSCPLPVFNPPIILNYPAPNSHLPDYFWLNGFELVSGRLRAAINLPSSQTQYVGLNVIATDPAVHAMRYCIMRVLAEQPAVDLKRSKGKIERRYDRFVDEHYDAIRFINTYAFYEGFEPHTELFHAREVPLTVFAADSLAERVMKAGCLGIEFHDPAGDTTAENNLIRTARGIEWRTPATRRAELRLAKRARAAGQPPV